MSLYRTSALFLALEDALDEACPNFTEAERSRALDQYDKAFLDALDNSKTKLNFKGHAVNYRFVDGVWQFELDASTQFTADNTTPKDSFASQGSTLLVCTDAKIARPEKYNTQPAAQATAQPATTSSSQ